MNRQEAIELLDNLIGMIEDNHGADYDTALHMAINSLKADEAYQLKYEHIPTITITAEEYMHLRECEDKCKNDKPLIKCNICKYYTKMEGCLNDRCERFNDITHPYCYCYWGKEKGTEDDNT